MVEHLFVAKHLEHQFQQGLGRVFAQLVGIALLQRQHFGNCGRQTGLLQPSLVFINAQPLQRGFSLGIQRDVAFGNCILTHPVTALLF